MDVISQTLLGAAAGQAVMSRPLGRLAVLAGGLGGLLADLDVFVQPLDPALPWELHRHFSHSLVAIPVGAAIATLPFLVFRKCREKVGLIYATAAIGYATHPLLDTMTSYGTHLLWPFVDARYSLDLLSIIDPIVTVMLMIGVVASLITGGVKGSRAGLIAFGLYLVFAVVQHTRAMGVQNQLAEMRGHDVTRGRLMPTIGNVIIWRSLYESDGVMHSDAVRAPLFDAARARVGDSMPLFTADDLPEMRYDGERLLHVYDRFALFADDWVGQTNRDGGDLGIIVLGDMRYSLDPAGFDPLWGLLIPPDSALEPVRAISLGRDRRGALVDLWRELWRGDERYRSVEDSVRD